MRCTKQSKHTQQKCGHCNNNYNFSFSPNIWFNYLNTFHFINSSKNIHANFYRCKVHQYPPPLFFFFFSIKFKFWMFHMSKLDLDLWLLYLPTKFLHLTTNFAHYFSFFILVLICNNPYSLRSSTAAFNIVFMSPLRRHVNW